MKIAIPCAEKKLCLHFGHCEEFTIITVDETTKVIQKQETLIPPPHEPGVLPKWLADHNVTIVIAGGMGSRAQQLFQENGIEVLIGAPSSDPETLVMSYLENTLETGTNTCDH